MSLCRSGDFCDQEDGYGTFGSFCEPHADQMTQVRDALFTDSGWARTAAVRPQVPQDTRSRLPRPVRALRVAHAVHERGWITRVDAAVAAGLDGTSGSLPRVISYAVEQGWVIALRGGGGGLKPGRTTPPAAA